MTGSSFRGPPDENVACVRIEGGGAEGLGGASEVVAYLPRGRRGTGRRERWFVVVLDEARAETFASALSDLLWHAREDGSREARERDVQARAVLGLPARCSECGGTAGACHAPGPAFPVERSPIRQDGNPAANVRFASESQPALRPPPRPPTPPTPPPYCVPCNAEHGGPCLPRPGLLARLFGRRA